MYDIITIGTATRDIFLTSPLFRVVSDPKHLKKIGFPTGEAQCFALGGKIEIGKPIFTTGGGASNAAVTFARKNLKVAALVKIGNDNAGEEILSEFKKEKIQSLAIKGNNKGTAYSTILLAPTGERTILVYRGASHNLKTEEIPFKKIKTKWAYIVPGQIAYSAMGKIFDRLIKNKILIAFNPSKYFIEMGIKKLKPFLSVCKVVILNREEASYLTGIDYQKEKEIFRHLDKIVSGIVIMTEGAKGVLVSDGKNIYQAGIFKEKKIIDRTGAGDAFGSGFVAGLIHQDFKNQSAISNQQSAIFYAVRLGSANATSVVEKIGAKAGILTRKEFEKNKRWQHLAVKIVKLK